MLYFCMHFEQNIYIVFQYCKHDIVDIFMYVKYKGDWILNSAWINVSNNWNIHLLRIYAHIIIVPFHDWLVSKAYLQIICQQLFTNKKVNNTNKKCVEIWYLTILWSIKSYFREPKTILKGITLNNSIFFIPLCYFY